MMVDVLLGKKDSKEEKRFLSALTAISENQRLAINTLQRYFNDRDREKTVLCCILPLNDSPPMGYLFSSVQTPAKFKEKLHLKSLPAPSDEEMAKIMGLKEGEELNLRLDGKPCRVEMADNQLSMYWRSLRIYLKQRKLKRLTSECIKHSIPHSSDDLDILNKLPLPQKMLEYVKKLLIARREGRLHTYS